jgi:hypothetical protein
MTDLRLTIDASDIPKAQAAVGGLERKIADLARRYASGSISQQTYNRGLLQLKRNYERVGVSSQKATSEVRRYAAAQLQAAKTAQQAAVAQRQLATATQGSTRAVNRSGVLMQQTGYQVGDFIVQVQSGTNWMVAFGQQATQVAGTLTLLQGKWVLIGSVLGIAIPLLTAIGAAFMRSSGEGKDFSDTLDELEQSISEYADAAERANQSTSELMQDFGRFSESIRPLLVDLSELNRLSALDRLQQAFEGLILPQESGILGQLLSGGRGQTENSLLVGLSSQLDLTIDQVRILRGSMEELAAAESSEDRVRVAESIANWIRISTGGVQNMNAEMRSLYQQFLEVSIAGANLYGEVEQANGAAEDLAGSFANAYREFQFIMSSAEEAADKISESKTEAELLADAVGSIDFSNALAQAEAFSRALGVSLNTARQIMGVLGGGAPALGTEENSVLDPRSPNFMPGLSERMGNQARLEGIRSDLSADARARASASSSGGGSGGGGGFMSIFPELAAQVQAAEQALSSFNQEADILNTALEQGMITQQQFNQMLQQAQESYGVADAAAAKYSETVDNLSQTLAQGIGSAFGDFFNSIIDGTKSAKDAFRDMVKAILKQLVQLFIIRPIMNSIQSALGGGGGLFGQGGSLFGLAGIPGRASGGSVMSGQPYMVGEKGRELFIPGQSGKIVNADQTARMAGGGDRVAVNLTYNFQGGVTEADLARALPKLVEETKRSVVDTVQRGGSVARVFR